MSHSAPSAESVTARIARAAILVGVLPMLLATVAAAADAAAVVEDFLSAYRAADVEKMTTLYGEDVRFIDVSQRHELSGREAMRESLGKLVAIHKEMGVEIKRRAVDGGLVTVEVVYSGTLDCAALGRPDHEDIEYALPAVLLFEVADGQIRSQTDYLDFRTFSESFAALQPPAGSK